MLRRRIAIWLIQLSVRFDSAALFKLCKMAMDDRRFLELAAKYEIIEEPTP